MNAAIISIGTELTRGELVNSNAQWLAEQLIGLGFDVIEHTAVADDTDRIVAALQRIATQAGVIVVTGGLGPTSDDLTAQAAASPTSMSATPKSWKSGLGRSKFPMISGWRSRKSEM